MAATTGEPIAVKGKKKGDEGNVTEVDDEEVDRQRRLDQMGPPNFYDADLERYYKKFDKSLKERQEFKHRLRGKMSFTDNDWNHNVDTSGARVQRNSKQVMIQKNGMQQSLRQKDF